jgi:hypothetical protein
MEAAAVLETGNNMTPREFKNKIQNEIKTLWVSMDSYDIELTRLSIDGEITFEDCRKLYHIWREALDDIEDLEDQ